VGRALGIDKAVLQNGSSKQILSLQLVTFPKQGIGFRHKRLDIPTSCSIADTSSLHLQKRVAKAAELVMAAETLHRVDSGHFCWSICIIICSKLMKSRVKWA
jgi:hypothetical protein